MRSRQLTEARTIRALAACFALASALVLCAVATPHTRQAFAAAASTSYAIATTQESSAATAPLPSQMATTAGAQQLLIATAPTLRSTVGTLQVFNFVAGAWVETMAVPARFGKRGLCDGKKRVAGNNTTPTGIWRMPNFVFGSHYSSPGGMKIKYRRITSRSWWSSRRGWSYNVWVEKRNWSGEHLSHYPKSYEFAVSTGYNSPPNPKVYGRGTCIFLHVKGTTGTAGCVAIARKDMIRVFRLLDPSKRPTFAVGTLVKGSATSIWAY
jgi:L,D-peptidoglycan transpeptidase YkuD (ErfK/YbiS/YcfS/YnhG family)